jgi:hypothetical protein
MEKKKKKRTKDQLVQPGLVTAPSGSCITFPSVITGVPTISVFSTPLSTSPSPNVSEDSLRGSFTEGC